MGQELMDKLERETIIKSEPAIWVDSERIMQNGRLVLTRKHLVFVLNNAQKAAIVIDLDTINSLSHEHLITDHNILAVTYLQYDTSKFSVLDYDSWEKAIEEQRMKPHVKMRESLPG